MSENLENLGHIDIMKKNYRKKWLKEFRIKMNLH